MAARRLLIVMLVLLGLSTLAAALIPQRSLNGDGTESTTRSTPMTTPTPAEPSGRALSARILVGGKKEPVVAGPVCTKRKPRCEPIQVGDQLTLLVYSRKPAQLEFREFGQFAFAAREAPARFELLLTRAGTFGITFADASPNKPIVAARIAILTPRAAQKAIAAKPRRRARAGSGPA